MKAATILGNQISDPNNLTHMSNSLKFRLENLQDIYLQDPIVDVTPALGNIPNYLNEPGLKTDN